jgi:hypothetical protein
VDEYIGPDRLGIFIRFMDPAELGFDTRRFAEAGAQNQLKTNVASGYTRATRIGAGEAFSPMSVIACALVVACGGDGTNAAKANQSTASGGAAASPGDDPGSLRGNAGIAVKVPKGTQLLLNLHLFNNSTEPISGTSGTLGQTISATDDQDTTLIAVAPHMHVLGSHMKVTAESSIEGRVVIHARPTTSTSSRSSR